MQIIITSVIEMRPDMNYQETCIAINELTQSAGSKLARVMQRQFSMQSLTAPQINILLLLDQNGPLKISRIAEGLGMADSNVSNICSRLEKAGLVERDRLKEDQRVVNIRLTEAANLKMSGIKASVNEFHNKMSGHISEKDLNDIFVGLTKLNALYDMFLAAAAEEEKP
jgi:DNA-binding MarR family transcriptional regulator